jgi:hypothetical protein
MRLLVSEETGPVNLGSDYELTMRELAEAVDRRGLRSLRRSVSSTAPSTTRRSAAEVAFVCVGTPPLPGGGPNLSYVEAVGATSCRTPPGTWCWSRSRPCRPTPATGSSR